MKITVKPAAGSRVDGELWRLGSRRLTHRIKMMTLENANAKELVLHSLNGNLRSFLSTQNDPDRRFEPDVVAGLFATAKSEAQGGTPLHWLPSPTILTQPVGKTLPDEIRQMEKAKPRRLVVALEDFMMRQEASAGIKAVSYGEFLRWEVARFLDELAVKHNIHVVPLETSAIHDGAMEGLHYALRMRSYRAATMHEKMDPENLLLLMDASEFTLTDNYDVALASIAVGTPAIFIDHLGMSSAFPTMSLIENWRVFQPYSFSATDALATLQSFLKLAEGGKQKLIESRQVVDDYIATEIKACSNEDGVVHVYA